MIFIYSTGAQRSVGQCRLGVDIVEYTDSPTYLFLARFIYVRKGTDVRLPAYRVMFSQTAGERCLEGTPDSTLVWTRYPLTGMFELWFTEDKAWPNVHIP